MKVKKDDGMEQKLKVLQKKNEQLFKMVNDEREKTAGYEQVARLYTAYISILLRMLNATEEKRVTIKGTDIKEALERFVASATYDTENDVYSLWCVEQNK